MPHPMGFGFEEIILTMKFQIASTKSQINHNDRNSKTQTFGDHDSFGISILKLGIYLSFVICFLGFT